MNVLIQQATIIATHSTYHQKVKDILIVNGIIVQIADNIKNENYTIINGTNLHVSVGWLDIFADFGTPGYEHKESLETGAKAAAAGGFTDVMLVPTTLPITDNSTQVQFLKERSNILPITIHPIGAVTKATEGQTLTEMYDMHQHGAVAFSDAKKNIQQAGVMLKALQYATAKNATIIQIPNDTSISNGGLINEGVQSTKLGLPGMPAIAEEIMIARDIELAIYAEASLHFTGVSTKKAIDLIKAAKKDGYKITCSATPYHLFFSDEDLSSYNTNLKVTPPLRKKVDVLALQQALCNGDIDCIASHHCPQSWDDKTCEFEYAKNGMITLQTLFGTVNGVVKNTERLVKMLTENNRRIFDIPLPNIEEKAEACLTIFEPDTKYIFEENRIESKSKNSAFVGQMMQGKVIGIIHKGKSVMNK